LLPDVGVGGDVVDVMVVGVAGLLFGVGPEKHDFRKFFGGLLPAWIASVLCALDLFGLIV
jgi:hypothetical protein